MTGMPRPDLFGSWAALAESHVNAEGLVLYPTYGCWEPVRDVWRIYLHGAHFEGSQGTLRQRLLVRFIRRFLKVPPAAIDRELFERRVVPFFREGRPQARVRVEIQPDVFTHLTGNLRDGRLKGVWEIPGHLVRELQQDGCISQGWLKCTAHLEDQPSLRCDGRVQLIPPQGVSIISDIDDTIKVSEVANRRALLKNTFLHEFHAVPGMARVYRRWSECGATFHYVSSSPAPLFEPLRVLMATEEFPLGSLHLRSLYLHNASLLQLLVTKPSSKRRMLAELIRAFPQRQFVLVGDSSERDPEIYGSLARRIHPRVHRILIRRTSGKRLHAERCRRVFRGVPFDRWSIFQEAPQLLDLLNPLDLTRLDRASTSGFIERTI
ncbi:MAG: DUF2183 domain-containing protein [Planctomycetota bacterium]|nr:DUF2183 domain-containing protein [Planctomycetota bacterium]